MDDTVIDPRTRAMWQGSVLGPHLASYGSYLREARYAPSTTRV